MKLVDRITDLISANLNHLLDKAEDPEAMIKQMIRDMEEGIIELRRETAKAMANLKLAEKKLGERRLQSTDLEEKAQSALQASNEELARQLLEKKLQLDESIATLETDARDAATVVEKMKSSLSELEDQVQSARQKKEALIRRKRLAEARGAVNASRQKSGAAAAAFAKTVGQLQQKEQKLQDYSDRIARMEAEAEAMEELANDETGNLSELEDRMKTEKLDAELERLKNKLDKKE